MPRRMIEIGGETWKVSLSGRSTSYARDQVGLLFELGTGENAVRRLSRYRPLASQRLDAALSEIPDSKLRELWHASQPDWTSPELGYGKISRD